MAYDRQHVLLTWGGALPGGETWVCGIRLAPPDTDLTGGNAAPGILDQDELTNCMGSWVPAVKTFHQAPGTSLNLYAQLKFVKAAAIGTDGKYLREGASSVISEFAPLGGAYAGTGVPNQVAIAVTTTTGLTRGLAKRGRFYLPMPNMVIGTDGLISQELADGLKGTAKTFIEAISDTPGVDSPFTVGAMVMSRVGAGASHKITGVAVGRVLDTQRRRRRSLREQYVLAPVDQGAF